MSLALPVFTIDKDALTHLQRYLKERNFRHLILIADENTYAALGNKVAETLQPEDFHLQKIILQGRVGIFISD
jgi:glycerol dehydrogenase-like iron-containing ADH family enzyme